MLGAWMSILAAYFGLYGSVTSSVAVACAAGSALTSSHGDCVPLSNDPFWIMFGPRAGEAPGDPDGRTVGATDAGGGVTGTGVAVGGGTAVGDGNTDGDGATDALGSTLGLARLDGSVEGDGDGWLAAASSATS